MKRVHLIDDDPLILYSLDLILEIDGFATTTHNSAAHFLCMMDEAKCAGCIVTDIDMPGMSGLELAAEMPKLGIECPVIIMTGHSSVETKRRASELGVFEFLEKPFDADLLVAEVRKAMASGRRVCARRRIF
jgi:two-component system, LuxR family, response regulator FixJ